MNEEREKNLHFSPLPEDVGDHAPVAKSKQEDLLEDDVVDLSAAAEQQVVRPQEKERQPESQGGGPRGALLWTAILVLASALAFHWYEGKVRISKLEAGLRTLVLQQSKTVAVDSSSVDYDEMKQRIELLESTLEIQRQRLQALELPEMDQEQTVPEEAAVPDAAAVPEAPVESVNRAEPEEDMGGRQDGDAGGQQDEVRPVTWSVILGSFRERDRANLMAEQLASADQLIEVLEYDSGGSIQYRVAVSGIEDPEKARDLADSLQKQWGLQGLWVSSD